MITNTPCNDTIVEIFNADKKLWVIAHSPNMYPKVPPTSVKRPLNILFNIFSPPNKNLCLFNYNY